MAKPTRFPRNLAAYTALALVAAGPAIAQDSGFALGAGVFSERRAYGDTTTSALPFLSYDSRYFSVEGTSADLKLPWISGDRLQFTLRARYSIGEGYEAADDPILSGMAEREGGLWLGGTVTFAADFADLSLEAVHDVSGDSDGSRIRLEAARSFRWDRFSLTPSIAATWLDDNAVNYFYGVLPSEAMAGRAAYEGTATTNISLGLRAGYSLTERQMILFDASVTSLGDGITRSPITTEDSVTSVGLGYIYRF
ncbi:MipA/OmpV family protein [Halodurantibacterium flavum]|uniref:MipA/OmpV family protein n=1 Tax=Halodurantibacterium flavum TaxID=1382802 RepID=A0ABW4S3V1_9RHOB